MNERLRAHVTRLAFDLQLGRTHILALVRLNEMRRRGWNWAAVPPPRNYPGMGKEYVNWPQAVDGLTRRGLITHPVDSTEWGITRAGLLVVEILQECGVYAEYERHLTYLAPALVA